MLHCMLKQSQSRDQCHREEEPLVPFLSGNHVLNSCSDMMMYLLSFMESSVFSVGGVPVHASRHVMR